MLRLYIIFEVYVNIVVDLLKSGEIRRYRNDHYYYILSSVIWKCQSF